MDNILILNHCRSQVKPIITNIGSGSSSEDEGVIFSMRNRHSQNKKNSSFNVLNGSDDESDEIGDDFKAKSTTNKLTCQRSRNPAWEPTESNNTYKKSQNNSKDDIEATNFQRQHNNDPIPKSFSHRANNQSSSRRKDTSRRKQGDEFNMNDIANQLPKHLRTNLSHMSSTVRFIVLK